MVTFNVVDNVAICENCGITYERRFWQQRLCKKNCSQKWETKRVNFVGVDGEGLGSDPSKYVLLGVGDQQIENPSGLGWKECFEFLYEQFEEYGKGTAFIGYFLGYDFTQILKSLPEDRARILLTIAGKAKRKHRVKGKEPHPVECDGWQFDILGNKRLRIRPKRCDCPIATCPCKKASWMFICDVGPFWQTSFLNVIDPAGWNHPVVTAEEYATILAGKNARGTALLDNDMRRYNNLENELLSRVMSALADGFENINIHLSPRQWFGPGQASSTWMKGKVPKREEWFENIPEFYTDAARESYYGGWFETFCHGHIKGKVYEYDINSAYPSVIATLPCLEHGVYSSGLGDSFRVQIRETSYCIVKARVHSPNFDGKSSGRSNTNHIGTMLHRSPDGSILRPNITEGWYWLSELEAARRARCVGRVDYIEWVNYEPCDCRPPFQSIKELYQVRLDQGKTSPLGKGSKLVYNSAYGKFAQSIGDPQFGNPIYASLITAGCRTQILSAIATHPEGQRSVAMVATDAIFFLSEHPNLPVNERLGQWDLTIRHNLTIFKPGVYWDDETRKQIREQIKPKFKARGINAQQFAEEIWKIDFAFNDWTDGQPCEFPDAVFESGFSMVTALQALMRNDWSLAGRNDPKTMYHSSDPFRKRTGLYWDSKFRVWRSNIVERGYDWTIGDWKDVSTSPYQKRFGMDDPFSDESRSELGVTEDGMVSDVFRFLLKNDE